MVVAMGFTKTFSTDSKAGSSVRMERFCVARTPSVFCVAYRNRLRASASLLFPR
jgi:hypothetical protein